MNVVSSGPLDSVEGVDVLVPGVGVPVAPGVTAIRANAQGYGTTGLSRVLEEDYDVVPLDQSGGRGVVPAGTLLL